MKTLSETSKITKITHLKDWLLLCCLITLFLHGCVSTVYVPERRTTVVQREVVPPPWAPQYDDVSEVRYYYLPDVEMYYDVWNHEYVYLNNGNWVFTATFPSYYSSYDINSAFVVVLDYKVHEPWRQHQLYASHYPRYYYRSVYNEDGRRDYDRRGNTYNNTTVINNTTIINNGGVRGFNENARSPIYRNPQQTNTMPSHRNAQPRQNNNSSNNQQVQQQNRTTPGRQGEGRSYPSDQNVNTNSSTNTNTSNPARRDISTRGNENNNSNRGQSNDNSRQQSTNSQRSEGQQNTETRPVRNDNVNQNRNDNANQNKNVETPSRTQPAVYSGKEVGQPVRVKREMQVSKESKSNPRDAKKVIKKNDSGSDSPNNTSGRR
ncbi:MAG TPA: hypothetical protein VIH57_23975 [Bacteroidales bacterium]